MEYLHVFESETDYNTARESNYKEPWVSATNIGGEGSSASYRVNYNKSEEEKEREKLIETPLTFEIASDGILYWKGISKTIEYQKNDGSWTSITSAGGSSAPSISVSAGDTVQFRGDNEYYAEDILDYVSFSSTCIFNAKGNIMSLINSKNFSTQTIFPKDYSNFKYLFKNCTGLTDASKLILPATTLTYSCYESMFQGCTSLTTAPELPATTLAKGCYNGMFSGCTSLISAPELPATTLSSSCYSNMFANTNVLPDCRNIDFASPTVVASCGLLGLFSGTKVTDNDLRQILPINPNTNNYYLPVTTLGINCYQHMFKGCTSLTTAPELPATTLKYCCYESMFQGCTSLTTAPELPATTLGTNCYQNMFNGCSSLTTAPALPATTLANYCYQYMFQSCTSLTTAPELPATTLAYYCYGHMFSGCTSLTTAPALPATTLADECYEYMFYGCTSLTAAPALPATTLAGSCYQYMFYNCSRLNYIKAMFTTTPGSSYTRNWVSGVASSGTFVKNSAATWNVSGVNGIPNGWTTQTATS